MLNRRNFLKTAALGMAGLSFPFRTFATRSDSIRYFGVHPFVETHPEAVFIMRTQVDNKLNTEAKKQAGLTFARSIFVPWDERGLPIDISIPVKLNLKTTDAGTYPLEHILGCITDPYFSEGVFSRMQELGIPGKNIHVRENDRGNDFGVYGIPDMTARAGVDFRTDFQGTLGKGLEPGRHFNWIDIPDGRYFKKLPQLEPVNQPNTWLLDMAKFKAHGMGITLCCKNLQGIVTRPFQAFCSSSFRNTELPADCIQENAAEQIKGSYARHVRENRIPRWDRPGDNGGIWQEIWSSRTLDHLSVTHPGLCVIEGIYGRDGDAGNRGPHEPLAKKDNLSGVGARDFMSNIIIFGKNPYRTDIIGHYLAGQEPGNFGFFHLALERKLSNALDPRKIPVYVWEDGNAILTPIEKLPRTPLLTYYLTRDYNGGTEQQYHLCNEPFDYSKVDGVQPVSIPKKPEMLVLSQSRVTDENPHIPLEYHLPESGNVRLEILDGKGKTIALPVNGVRSGGTHLAALDSRKMAAGTYTWRLRTKGNDSRGTLKLEK
jgi:hypothetical protein